MKTIAFIPVRGGSKSIPKKNIKLLAGRPLLHFTLSAAVSTPEIDEVYVSSDSEEILASARAFGHRKVKCVHRPAEFATDTASTESAMLDFAKDVSFERIVLIQATSPLTQATDLEGALKLLEEMGADSLLSGTHEFRFRWERQSDGFAVPKNYDPQKRPRRQDWQGELVENGAFYITSREALLRTGCRISGKTVFWPMPSSTAFEIDTPDDWVVLEALTTRDPVPDPIPSPGQIKLLITDVDGVLTDGGMYYDRNGDALKKFNTRDGMGISLFRSSGGVVAIVTGEHSPAVVKRAEKLNIDECHLGVQDKLPVVRRLAEKYSLKAQEIAYIGDDINDLSAMSFCGFVACPVDAHPRVQAVANVVCKARGGAGCVREFVDILLSD